MYANGVGDTVARQSDLSGKMYDGLRTGLLLTGIAIVIGLVASGCTGIVSTGIIAIVVTGHRIYDMLRVNRLNDMIFPIF